MSHKTIEPEVVLATVSDVVPGTAKHATGQESQSLTMEQLCDKLIADIRAVSEARSFSFEQFVLGYRAGIDDAIRVINRCFLHGTQRTH